MINARADSVTTSNACKSAFKRKPAILPADGFYEWKKLPGGKRKQPYYFERRDRGTDRASGAVGRMARTRRRGRAVAYRHDHLHGPQRDDEANP